MSDRRNVAEWDAFWETSSAQATFCNADGTHPRLRAHWHRILPELLQPSPSSKHIDLATGNGVVIRHIRELFGTCGPVSTGLDLARTAIDALRESCPEAIGIVGDIASTRLDGAGFDLVTSQYGVEYAGLDGFSAAAKLLRRGGALAFVCHSRPGVVYEECATNWEIMDRIRQSRLLPRARSCFKAAINQQTPSSNTRERKGLSQVQRQLRRLINRYGVDAASGFPARLANDIANIDTRVHSYDGQELLNWIGKLERESLEYRSRMHAMTRAALGRSDLRRVLHRLERAGLSVIEANEISDGPDALRLGWSIIAQRPDRD